MKRILFFVAFTVAAALSSNAQSLAAKAGYGNLSVSLGEGVSASVSGVSFGISADFEMTQSLDLQPEVMYTSFEGGGLVSIPVMAKYYLGESFNIQGGPQMNYDIGEAPEDFNAIGLGIAAGGGYDISDQFFVDARYNFEVTNRYTGEGEGDWSYSLFSLGLGYRF